MTPEEIEARQQQAIDELMNAKHPIPDPAWDYAEVWKHLWSLKHEADSLIQELGPLDGASEESDRQIRVRLQWIAAYSNQILSLLD